MSCKSATAKDNFLKAIGGEQQDPLEALKQTLATQPAKSTATSSESQQILVQDFVPVADSIEWQLSNWHWEQDGVDSFVAGEVPYIINNSGRLSLQSAKLLYAWLDAREFEDESITLLELGAGTGLFARYLLDNLKRLCDENDTDYLKYITFYVTDYSQNTIRDWQERGIFDDYQEQVVLATCDAKEPHRLVLTSGECILLNCLCFVFCNYMLDVLPATMLKQVDGQWHELQIATHINTAQIDNEQQRLLDEVKSRVDCGERPCISQLKPLRKVLDFTIRYVPLRASLHVYLTSLPDGTEDGDRFLLNYAAIESLEKLLDLVHPEGAILINDYGPTQPEHIKDFAAFSRFGATIATGLNFLHFQPYFEFAGFRFEVPDHTEKASVQNRLLGHDKCLTLSAHFQQYFAVESELYYLQPVEEARRALTMDNKTEVLGHYYQALAINPHDWSLLTEIADYLIMQVEDFETGLTLVKAALKLNPWYSAWAWNVLGDGYYCQDKIEEAHQVYLQAQRISPSDPRTQLNLAYTYIRRGEYQTALDSVAVGLANDVESEFRIKLLEKQQQILSAITEQFQANQQQMQSRNQRLCD